MEIHWSHFDQLDDVDQEVIEQQLYELAHEYPDLIDVRIFVSRRGSRSSDQREVRITGLARGRQIVAAHEGTEVTQALKYLVEAVERELCRRGRH